MSSTAVQHDASRVLPTPQESAAMRLARLAPPSRRAHKLLSWQQMQSLAPLPLSESR